MDVCRVEAYKDSITKPIEHFERRGGGRRGMEMKGRGEKM
jgi:hypothetical protein